MQIAIDLPWARRKSAPVELPNIELPQVDLAAKVEDTKRAISDGADQISTVAADLGGQAAAIGREAMKIGRDAAKASRGAARKGQLFAATGTDTLRQLRTDAATVADDLRSIRIVRESRRGPDLKPGIALAAGISTGAAVMYFLDPEQGRRRRVTLMEQLHKYARLSREWFESTTRDLRNRTHGLAQEARKAAEQVRAGGAEAEADLIAASPDVAQELERTDWSEPVTADTIRSNG